MALSQEATAKIYEWRQKSIAGTLSRDEMKAAIETLRNERVGASIASTTSRTRKAADKAPIDTGALLAGLMKKPEATEADHVAMDQASIDEEADPDAA